MNKLINKYLTILILFLIIVFFHPRCYKAPDSVPGIDNMFTRIDTLILTDDMDISHVWDMKRLNDSTLVATDFFGHGIFFINTHTGKDRRIGDLGQGPGEYVWPSKLAVTKEGYILCSDIQTTFINQYDRTGQFIHTINQLTQADRFCVNDMSDIYFIATGNPLIRKISHDEQEILKVLDAPQHMDNYMMGVNGGGICCDHSDHFYASLPMPYEIIHFNSELEIIHRFERREGKYFTGVNRLYDLGDRLSGREKRKIIKSNLSSIQNIYYINTPTPYLLVHVNGYHRKKRKVFLDVWNTDGRLIETLWCGNEYPVGACGKELYTSKILEDLNDPVTIYIYTLSPETNEK